MPTKKKKARKSNPACETSNIKVAEAEQAKGNPLMSISGQPKVYTFKNPIEKEE